MRKRNLKNLTLKRDTISSLDACKLKGAEAMSFGIICILYSLANGCDDTINCHSNYPCHQTDTIP